MTMTVNGPGGISVNFPDGTDSATIDQVMRQAVQQSQMQSEFAPTPGPPELQSAISDKVPHAQEGWIGPLAQGLTLGFGDEMLGGVGGLITAAKGQGFQKGYDALSNAVRRDTAAEFQRHPYRSTALEIAGSLPSVALPVGKVAEGASLLGRMGAGAKAGATIGGLFGVGTANGGPINRAVGGVSGAVSGGLTGAALPVVGSVARGVASPFVKLAQSRSTPDQYAMGLLANKFMQGGRSLDQAASRLSRATQRGQRMSLADVGGQDIQDFARTAVNVPGPARNAVTAKVNIAQMGQGQRLKDAIGRLFADPNSYQATKEGVIAARQTAASPYYKAAEKVPIPYSFELQSVLETPAGKAALAQAKTNSLNSRQPWAQWFVNVDNAGNIIDARRVPDTRALDEVKKTLDRMVESAKSTPDGSPFAKPMSTPQSMAIDSVRRDLLNIMDQANPLYAKARSVGMDNIQADQALEFGRNSLTVDPRVIQKTMAGYSDGQRELARIGQAEALRGKIDSAGMTHNAILRIFNSSDQRARLRAMFPNQKDFNDFRTFIYNEARRTKTRQAVTGNSTTAKQISDMAGANDLASAMETGHNMFMWGPRAAGLQALQKVVRHISSFSPEVAGKVGQLLMSSDPAKVQSIISQVRAIQSARLSSRARTEQLRQYLTRLVASQEGSISGYLQSSPQGAR